jgi:predicted ribosomally synthesized peptide with SipW-like signal peptide
MKRRVLFSVLAIVIIAAAFGAGTMAWFTAKAEAPENTFTAGTVMIEAGSSSIRSQYFDPSEGVFVYGIQRKEDGADIYEIDVLNATENMIFPNPQTYSGFYPNALAFDGANDRLYFARNSSQLWFYDFSTDTLVNAGNFNHSSKTGAGDVYGATFGGGYFWYVPNNTAYLYRVTLDGAGNFVSSDYELMTEDDSLQFGDIVIDYADGVIYGSDSGIYFTYDIATEVFSNHGSSGRSLQLAWGHDGNLYGHATSNKNWYEVDPADGTKEFKFTGVNIYNDLATGNTSYWNPGDCAWKKYTVKNTGSKNIRVRLELSGEWEFDWEWLWENWDALCFSERAEKPEAMEGEVWDAFESEVLGLPNPVTFAFCDPDQDDWVDGGDGYWYYTGSEYDPIAPDDELELCFKVCLDGEGATNEFQGGRFKLNAKFEAVQSSNFAPFYEWNGITFYGEPE